MTTTTAAEPTTSETTNGKQQGKQQEKTTIWGNLPDGSPVKIPILGVAGDKSSGKTMFVNSIDPVHTVAIDLEDSSETYNFPFLRRFSLFEAMASLGRKPLPIDVFIWVQKILQDEIPKIDGVTVVTIDPANDFQSGLYDYIVHNHDDFGLSAKQVQSSSGLVWGAAKSHLKMLLGTVSKKSTVQTLAFANHIGVQWNGGAPSSKKKAKGVDTFYELASLFIWLTREGNQELPTGSIVPPYGKSRLSWVRIGDDGEVTSSAILPPRIDPCTVKRLREYIAHPANYDKLKKAEKYVENHMSDEDKLELQAQIAADNRAAEEARSARLEAVKRATESQQKTSQAEQHDAAAKEAVATVATQNDSETGKDAPREGSGHAADDASANCPSGGTFLHERIRQNFRKLLDRGAITVEKVQAIVKNNGAEKIDELSQPAAMKIHEALVAKLQMLDVEQEITSGAAQGN